MTDTLLRASLQSGVALLVIALLCRLFSQLSASTRCWLWRLGYVKCLATFAIASVVELPILPTSSVPPVASSLLLSSEWLPSVTKSLPPATESSFPTTFSLPLASESALLATKSHSGIALSGSGIAFLYCLGTVIALLRLVIATLQTAMLLRRATPATLPITVELSERFGLRKAPRIGRLSGFSSPLLAFNTILLPEPALADEHLILAHELAHVKRRDLLWEALGALVQVLFWFHPLVWYARREEKLAREQAADALALAITNAPRADYARVLLTATLRRTPTLAIGAFASPSRLHQRLEALAQPALPKHKTLGLLTLASILAIPALIPWRAVARQATQTSVSTPVMPLQEKVRPALTQLDSHSWKIRGRVIDAEGKPLVGAQVQHLQSKRRWMVTKEGRFSGEGLVGFKELVASAPGYIEATASSYSDTSGFQIVLKRTGVWEATFQDSNGKPLSNLPVCLTSGMYPGRTNAQGRYVISGLGILGTRDNAINSPHFKTLNTRWAIERVDGSVSPGMFRQRFILVPARTLSGKVLDAYGKPVANCHVMLRQTDTGVGDYLSRRSHLSTDKEGVFQFTQIRPGKYRVSTRFWNTPTAEIESPELSLETNNVAGLVLTLTPGITVRGIVRAAKTGSPVPRTFIRIAEPTSYMGQSNGKRVIYDSRRYSSHEADAQGRYELHLAPGKTYRLTAGGSPVSSRYPEAYEKTIQGKEGDVIEANFQIERPRPLVGRVVDSTGRLIAGAALELRGKRHGFPSQGMSLRTDAHGDFSIPEAQLGFGFQEGMRSQNGKSEHYQEYTTSTQLVASKDELRGELTVNAKDESLVTVVLKSGQWITIHGQVRDSQGNVPPGVQINASLWGKDGPAANPSVIKDALGNFTVRAEPGSRLSLECRTSDKQLGFASFNFPETLLSGTVKDLGRIVLPKADGFLAGEVRDSSGKPPKKAMAIVFGSHTYVQSPLDSQGRFLLKGIVPSDTLDLSITVPLNNKQSIWRIKVPLNKTGTKIRLGAKPDLTL